MKKIQIENILKKRLKYLEKFLHAQFWKLQEKF